MGVGVAKGEACESRLPHGAKDDDWTITLSPTVANVVGNFRAITGTGE
jgi:hypothetical protein